MEKNIEILENFKKAITSTIKSIAGNQNIDVNFGDVENKTKNKTITLPLIKNINKNDFIKTRAIADSAALKLRCSDEKIFKTYEPGGNISKILYKIAEKIRYENIGSSYFKGVKENLDQFYKIKSSQNIDYKNSDLEFIDAFEFYLRDNFAKTNEEKIKNKYKKYKKKLDLKLKNKFDQLHRFVLDQKKFNALMSNIISQLRIDQNKKQQNKKEDQKDQNNLENKTNDQNNEESKKKEDNELSKDAGLSSLDQLAQETGSSLEEGGEDVTENSLSNQRKNDKNFGDSKYKVYTQEFDEVVDAKDLENEQELTRLRKNLDQQLLNLKNFISKLANKLQRKLLAKQNRSWEFDLEEGALDSSKLTRIIIDPLNSLSFKSEK